jgi:hypothetical protein
MLFLFSKAHSFIPILQINPYLNQCIYKSHPIEFFYVVEYVNKNSLKNYSINTLKCGEARRTCVNFNNPTCFQINCENERPDDNY